MNPSWSIFDCRQLVSFRLPLTVYAALLDIPITSNRVESGRST